MEALFMVFFLSITRVMDIHQYRKMIASKTPESAYKRYGTCVESPILAFAYYNKALVLKWRRSNKGRLSTGTL